jgi:hypothetical protein
VRGREADNAKLMLVSFAATRLIVELPFASQSFEQAMILIGRD